MLKKPSDHTPEQAAVLARHRKSRHACWRAQQLKEDFRGLYQLRRPSDAGAYLDRWLARVSRCRIAPMLKAARTVRDKRDGIVAAVELGLSNSRLEGTNSKIRMINHRGYGHHSVRTHAGHDGRITRPPRPPRTRRTPTVTQLTGYRPPLVRMAGTAVFLNRGKALAPLALRAIRARCRRPHPGHGGRPHRACGHTRSGRRGDDRPLSRGVNLTQRMPI